MKIAFDGQLLLDKEKTGIAWNAHNLILELAKLPENECILQCFTCRGDRQMQRLDPYRKAGCRVECCSWFSHELYKLLSLVLPLPRHLLFRTKPDMTQFFNFQIPSGVKGKRIVFIHDMAYRSCPQTVRTKTRFWLRLSMKSSCRRADHLITVSEFSKKEIVRYLKVVPEKITVVPNAVDHTIYHPRYTKEQITNVQARYGIEGEYILYLGTIEPRKNLERLIDAYAALCRQKQEVPVLVLAGRKGWMCADIYQKAQQLQKKGKILFPGYIRQKDSPVLMCGAKLFVFLSLYEGFGMPLLEAMACGTPVLASAAASMPEIAGNAAAIVDPENVAGISRAIRKLLEDDAYRETCRQMGLKRAAGYTWEASAALLQEVYRFLN